MRNWVPETFSPQEGASALKENFDEFAVELPFDTKVFRGVAYANELPPFEEGAEWTDKGLVSTSTNPEFARSFGDGSDVDAFIEIQVPKGTKVWCPQTAYVREETELTLRPDTRFRVKEVYEDKDSYGKVQKIVLEVVND